MFQHRTSVTAASCRGDDGSESPCKGPGRAADVHHQGARWSRRDGGYRRNKAQGDMPPRYHHSAIRQRGQACV
jgi:hypothetical protein